VVIRLKRKAVPFVCPMCGGRYLVYHDRLERSLRDLDLGRLRTMLLVKRHRIDCTRCGRQKERLPFARPDARATRRFEEHLYDRFHVMKALNHAVDLVRRRVQKRMTPPERKIIKNKRYVSLKASENLSNKDRVRLKELPAVNEEISASYILKEDFREWFSRRSPAAARDHLRDWIGKVHDSGIPELLKFVELLHRRRRGLRNYFLHRVTNSLSEGFNNVVKTIKKVAYGFHDPDYFRLKILRQCGQIEAAEVDL